MLECCDERELDRLARERELGGIVGRCGERRSRRGSAAARRPRAASAPAASSTTERDRDPSAARAARGPSACRGRRSSRCGRATSAALRDPRTGRSSATPESSFSCTASSASNGEPSIRYAVRGQFGAVLLELKLDPGGGFDVRHPHSLIVRRHGDRALCLMSCVCLREVGAEEHSRDQCPAEGEGCADEERRVVAAVQRGDGASPPARRLSVRDAAMLARIARPSAPPIMNEVLTTPGGEARLLGRRRSSRRAAAG